jgi:Tol biopolymer transport system component
MASCSGPGTDFIVTDELPDIFPDYCGVTVPVNIAPLNFRLENHSGRMHVVIDGKNGKLEINGKRKTGIPLRKWHELLKNNSDDSVTLRLHLRRKQMGAIQTLYIHIKKETVDPWLVYRLIAPGYESWSEMGLYQRDLTSFNTETIIDNRLLPGACMNCHSFRANSPDDMIFHLRGNFGATMLVNNGTVSKLNTKTSETISNCVYPYWHPSGKYVAFSVNNISQVFHSVKEKRIEVFDSKSDLVVYDIKANKLLTSRIISSEESLETFPAFSPDGNSLIFCSARKGTLPDDYDKLKYNLCKISFDPLSGSFGDKTDTLVSSAVTGKSVSFPRVSPDGKYLVFTLSDYGNFSIWHREADLYQLDLASGAFHSISSINSKETESYHSWSSNSRWLVFSSRRTDGLYTRPFIAYSDRNGNFAKPFMVPQKDPDYYDESLSSFNVPEFVTGKVSRDGRAMIKSIGSTAKNVNFELEK